MEKVILKKILPEYFQKVLTGEKTFEIRKDEDDAKVGDIIELYEFENGELTGRVCDRIISYVLRDAEEYGLKEGFAIYGLMHPYEWDVRMKED